jgi:predicted permease
VQTIIQDVRYAQRQLLKAPGFALTAVISLALGIGATTAVFSVIYAALINPYPYPSADRIVRLTLQTKTDSGDWANLDGQQVQQVRSLGVIQGVIAMDYHAMVLTGHDVPENANVVGLISNGWNDLGVAPLLGRGLLPSDAVDGQDPQPVAVLSYKFWRQHFLSDPGVVGKTLELDHRQYVVVGVAAPRFTWYSADVFVPLNLMQQPARLFVTDLLLRPGVTHSQADAALGPLIDQFAKATPNIYPEQFKVRVEGLNEWVNRSIRGTLFLLLGAVALLLAIGCANVSILLLARGAARHHELAVRFAIGASRRRILRQLFTESLLLAAVGAGFGVAASYGMLAGMKTVLPQYAFAPEVVININLPVLLVSVAVGLSTGILFGLWPALHLSRAQTSQAMASGTRRVAGSVSGRRAHNLLIAGQVALTLPLLAAAGSATQGFLRMMHRPLGYDPHNVMSVGIPLRATSYPNLKGRAAYIEQLRSRVAGTPGVALAALSSNATPPSSGWDMKFEILSRPASTDQQGSINWVDADYFAALRIPLLQGRIWSEAEDNRGARVAVVNRTFADRYFLKGDVIGQSVRLPRIPEKPPLVLAQPGLSDAWIPIVGVVGDALNDGLQNAVKPAIFMPYTLTISEDTQILVRANARPLTLLHTIKDQLATVNPDQQTYSHVDDLEAWIAGEPEWQQEHLAAWIFGTMAWLALALAAVGLYSVVSYTVAQRTNEFGIRMALGAQPAQVLKLVLTSTFASLGTGIFAGLLLTFALNKILAKWAEGNSHDPIILLAGVLLLALVAVVASAIPARHASRIDPMSALRQE